MINNNYTNAKIFKFNYMLANSFAIMLIRTIFGSIWYLLYKTLPVLLGKTYEKTFQDFSWVLAKLNDNQFKIEIQFLSISIGFNQIEWRKFLINLYRHLWF